MSIPFSCLLLVLVIGNLHRRAEAANSVDVNRVLMSYNLGFDICKEVNQWSGPESKAAADEACDQAFRALDDLELNNCHGWRFAECRVVPGDPYQSYQCSCMATYCDDLSIKSHIVTPFRNCAPLIREEEERLRATLAPSQNVQQCRSNYDNALREAHMRRTYSQSRANGEASTSTRAHSSGHGSSSAAHPSHAPVAGSSSNGGEATNPRKRKAVSYNTAYPCDQCGEVLKSKRILFNHKRFQHAIGDMHCYICNSSFKGRKTFVEHFQKKHPEISVEEMELESLGPEIVEALLPYACSVCKKRFSSERSLKMHMKIHTTADTKCPVCGRILSSRPALEYHVKSAHPGAPIPERDLSSKEPSAAGEFKCSECDRTYASKKCLLAHAKIHDPSNAYCHHCDKTLGTPFSFRRHMGKIHNEFPSVKTVAAKAEKEKEKEREKEEKKKRRVECEECGKSFSKLRGLREHKRSHEGHTKCDECGGIFSRVSNLTEHKKRAHKKNNQL